MLLEVKIPISFFSLFLFLFFQLNSDSVVSSVYFRVEVLLVSVVIAPNFALKNYPNGLSFFS